MLQEGGRRPIAGLSSNDIKGDMNNILSEWPL
jgi:hypothetical protein